MIGKKSRSCAFAPDGEALAVGTEDGGIKVLTFYPEVRQVVWLKTFNSGVNVLTYSPCGRYLAAGSHDQVRYLDVV